MFNVEVIAGELPASVALILRVDSKVPVPAKVAFLELLIENASAVPIRNLPLSPSPISVAALVYA